MVISGFLPPCSSPGTAPQPKGRALARHLGRREHMSDIVQAVAGLLSHQQAADLILSRQM
ncbi:hypothetical protein T261_0942 [Streptomyces lydicus]|nr:hypothetical protein T261_0942 [Streptomyces lydicus]